MAANPAFLDSLRLSAPALRLQAIWQRAKRRLRSRRAREQVGTCPVCARATGFVSLLDNPREDPQCVRCGSVPRQRALVALLARLGLDLAATSTHESSPSLCTYDFFRRRCQPFVASYFRPGVAAGARLGAFRCVDLGHQPFAEATFDLVVTQDVLEHVPEPSRALREIERTLKPGGRHVFTVPRADWRTTTARAVWRDGTLHLLAAAEFHRVPVAKKGTLVVTDWGSDLEQIISNPPHTSCIAHLVCDPTIGVPSPIEVFVTTKVSAAERFS